MTGQSSLWTQEEDGPRKEEGGMEARANMEEGEKGGARGGVGGLARGTSRSSFRRTQDSGIGAILELDAKIWAMRQAGSGRIETHTR